MAGVSSGAPVERRTVSLAPLLKILQCPVCLATVKLPFKLCLNGHLVCCPCSETLPHCPTCRSDFSPMENPVCVKSIIEALNTTCRYENAGCGEFVDPDSDHHLFCPFRSVACKKCGEEMPAVQLKDHDHPEGVLHVDERSTINLLQFQACFSYIVRLFVFDTSFWLNFKKITSEMMTVDFEGVFVGKPTDDFFIVLKFEKNGIGSTVTLKASENTVDASEKFSGSTKVVMSTIIRCLGELGELAIDYELCRKPKTA